MIARRGCAAVSKSPRSSAYAGATRTESDVTPERTFLCYKIAVATALLTAFGTQLVSGLCYLVAGMLGYLGPVRTWRWIVTMIAIQSVYMVLSAGSGLSLWPLALVMTAVIMLPGILTG